ncbi:MAG TPA: hypothetical protein VJG30_03935 [Candidatus Nanoarchaeia archaeon]|nr:hypothetical protein [Candidatus Nanoarchaeia archaeon]
MKSKLLTLFVVLLLVLPMSLADSSDSNDSGCSFFSLLSCLGDVARIVSHTTGLAAQPFISWVVDLMTTIPNTGVFESAWFTIIGIISVFYIFFLLYSGSVFILNSEDIVKRHHAKESIKNMIIALVLVSSSFYLYNLLIELNSSLTGYVFSNVSPSFFTVTSDSFGNALLQILMIIPYVLVLIITCIFLLARWVFVSLGVIFFPIGIFLYFVHFLRSYGKLIINLIVMLIFIPFICSIIILGCSLLVTAPIVEHFTIIFYIVSFLLVDLVFLLLIKFIINKSGMGEVYSEIKTGIMMAAGGV